VLAILAFLVGGILWMLAPFLDRKAARDERSPVVTWLGIIVLLYIVIMTVVTYTVPKL